MGPGSGQRSNFGFNLPPQCARGAHHEENHAHYQHGRRQHYPTFDFVLVDRKVRKQNGAGHAADQSRDQSRIDGASQIGPPNLGQIHQGDADDERGFNTFP